MAKKTYSKLREFNKELEPVMKGHELIVFNHITAAGKDGIEREDLVVVLQKGIDAGDFECKQVTSGMLSFQMGNLRKRGLIKEVVEKTATAGRAAKTTLTIKILKRVREFDKDVEPKMGSAEAWVFKHINAKGVRRPDLVMALEAAIKDKSFETAQKPSSFISFHTGNLRKRGLIADESVEEPKVAEAPPNAKAA